MDGASSNTDDGSSARVDAFLDEVFDVAMGLSIHSGGSIDGLLDEAMGLIAEDVDDESESDHDDRQRKWGGSYPGRAPNKPRDFLGGYERVVKDYFSGEDSVYDEIDFERRWVLERENFNKVRDAIIGKGSFVYRENATKKPQIHPLCRILACIRVLSYGSSADSVDDYLRIGESTTNAAVKEFARLIIENFESEYLGYPEEDELRRVLEFNERRGFPGMFASWDCSHWKWKNCPITQAGQHKGRKEGKTLVQESVVDHDLYCYYHSFGFPGSCNDINVLLRSETVYKFLTGEYSLKAPENYTINGRTRDWLYFLTDGIYLAWAIFCKPYSKDDAAPKHVLFSTLQEGVRKDVERFFSVLAEEFGILQTPLRNWYIEDISNIVKCCVILHNMNVASRRSRNIANNREGRWWEDRAYQRNFPAIANAAVNPNSKSLFAPMIREAGVGNENEEGGEQEWAQRVAYLSANMRDRREHFLLREDLTEHIWQLHHPNN